MVDWKIDLMNTIQSGFKFRKGDVYVCSCNWCKGEWFILMVNNRQWCWLAYETDIFDIEEDNTLYNLQEMKDDGHHDNMKLVHREGQ